MEPSTEARQRMVEQQLRARGIDDARVLEAMGRLPREAFVPPALAERAYDDRALPVGHGATLSQPYMVAAMTQALDVVPGARVLEIGTGTGYQTAVLELLGAEVWSVERVPALAAEAAERLRALGLDTHLHIREGDGSLGWPDKAPFDRILVTAGAPRVPPALLAQLSADGGVLVAPVGTRSHQNLVRLRRSGTEFEREVLMGCQFVPLVGEGGWFSA